MMKKTNPFAEIDRVASAKRRKLKKDESDNDDEDLVPMANKTRSVFNPNKEPIYDKKAENDDDSMDEYSSGAEDDDSDGGIDEDDTVDKDTADIRNLKEKIKDMPMSKIRELKDKIGLKLWQTLMNDEEPTVKEALSDDDISDDDDEEEECDEDDVPKEIKKKKKSSTAPREMSFKKPVSALRKLDFGVNKKKHSIDPRFNSRSGEYIESEFIKDYGFIYDMQQQDLKNLTKEMKKSKKTNPTRYNELKNITGKLRNQLSTARDKKIVVEAKDELKKKNIERMNAGLKPIFINNKNMKDLINKKKTEYRTAMGTQNKYEKTQKRKIRKGQKKQFKGKKDLLGIDNEE